MAQVLAQVLVQSLQVAPEMQLLKLRVEQGLREQELQEQPPVVASVVTERDLCLPFLREVGLT